MGVSIDDSVRILDATDQGNLAELTQHIPPGRLQPIRRYALGGPDIRLTDERPLGDGEEATVNARKRASAKLLAKVYGGCAEMEVIAVIENPPEIGRIRCHLVKIGRSHPGLNVASVN